MVTSPISGPDVPIIVDRIDTPGNAWTLDIKGKYLYVANGVEEYQIIDISHYARCLADFNGDGDTDGNDLGVFVAAFGSVIGDPSYNDKCDFDNSGEIDDDLGAFVQGFGKTDCME